VVEDAGVGRRIAPRRAPDRALVDVDDLVEVVETGDRAMPTGHLARAVELVGQDGVDDVVDQRRLARARHPVTATRQPSGKGHVDALQVVLAASLDDRARGRVGGRRTRRDRDAAPPGQVGTGQRVRARSSSATEPETTTCPPCSPRPGPMSTTQSEVRMVSSSCSTTMSVLPRSRSRVSVSMSRGCRAGAARWTARRARRGPPTSPEPDLRREPDPLRLTAGERARRAVEGEVVETRRRAGSPAER
jgi:hypothetical protein